MTLAYSENSSRAEAGSGDRLGRKDEFQKLSLAELATAVLGVQPWPEGAFLVSACVQDESWVCSKKGPPLRQ